MPERPVAPALRPFDLVGGWTIGVVESLGRFGTFFAKRWRALVTPPFKLRAFLDRIDFVGYRSLLIIF
jgi:ABC-type transporter Mla maintaining outer membrane lipid asymmetry permease subunit MlaE